MIGIQHIQNTSMVHELAPCDIGGEPAAGFFCCKTFGDVFRCGQDLQRDGEYKTWEQQLDLLCKVFCIKLC